MEHLQKNFLFKSAGNPWNFSTNLFSHHHPSTPLGRNEQDATRSQRREEGRVGLLGRLMEGSLFPKQSEMDVCITHKIWHRLDPSCNGERCRGLCESIDYDLCNGERRTNKLQVSFSGGLFEWDFVNKSSFAQRRVLSLWREEHVGTLHCLALPS